MRSNVTKTDNPKLVLSSEFNFYRNHLTHFVLNRLKIEYHDKKRSSISVLKNH